MDEYVDIDEYVLCPYCGVELMRNLTTNEIECPCCFVTSEELENTPYESIYFDD